MADLFEQKSIPASRKGEISTIKFGNLDKIEKKLIGSSEAVIEKFEELFRQCSELYNKCAQYSAKEMSDSFEELQSEALELTRRKDELESAIHELFEKYKDQNLPKLDPKAVLLKRESKLIIERVQRAIDKCRPIVEQVREKRKKNSSKKSNGPGQIVDFGEEIDNPFDED
ncbi:MAG: hypothetical protein HQM13_05985 [SAR324 cluster bacterium]|nr:hypothetical protein [SAR324 cluster bacterium]